MLGFNVGSFFRLNFQLGTCSAQTFFSGEGGGGIWTSGPLIIISVKPQIFQKGIDSMSGRRWMFLYGPLTKFITGHMIPQVCKLRSGSNVFNSFPILFFFFFLLDFLKIMLSIPSILRGVLTHWTQSLPTCDGLISANDSLSQVLIHLTNCEIKQSI